MPVTTRSASLPLGSSRNAASKYWPAASSSAAAAAASRVQTIEDDFQDIDGTTLNYPPQESSAPGSDTEEFFSPTTDGSKPLEPISPIQSGLLLTPIRSGQSYPFKSPSRHVNTGHNAAAPKPPEHSLRPSEATICTTEEQPQIYQPYPLKMLALVPKLNQSSDKVLNIWNQHGSSYSSFTKYITNPTSKIRIEESWGDTFLSYKRNFDDKHFINVAKTVDALPSLEHLDWDPTEIYQKANFAQLTLDMIYFCNGTQLTIPLDIIDSLFPTPFYASLSTPDDVITSLFQIGLEIRTHRCILNLKDVSEDILPSTVLDDVFGNAIAGEPGFRGWEIDGLQDGDGCLPENFREDVQHRVTKIESAFGKGASRSIDFSMLTNSFPWSEFVMVLGAWVQSRIGEINDELKRKEDNDSTIFKFRSTLRRRHSFSSPVPEAIALPTTASAKTAIPSTSPSKFTNTVQDERTATESTPSVPFLPAAPRKNFISRTSIRHLQALKMKQRSIPPAAVTSNQHEPLRNQYLQTSEAKETTFHANQQGKHVRDTQVETLAQPMTIFDRQENAHRVSPIQSSQVSVCEEQALTENTRKRRHTAEVEGDDILLVNQTRTPTRKLQRAKRRRVEPSIEKARSKARSPSVVVRHRQASRPTGDERPAGSASRFLPSSLNSEDINPSRQVTEAPSSPKRRTPWTVEESRQLVRLIREHGPKWSLIKSIDSLEEVPQLERRNQVQIKDRARQMAFDVFRTGQPVPKNFKKIFMNTMQENKLKAMGINFEEQVEEE
ncbi:hypothetical protein LOZ51_004858 [Ophidiomyces ophidiicola]|nr:hypothetical protein LOZ55_000913 [Ophidiomyces ophidiicola]KAI1990507.1 hypothetical protein LOZ51_004858 [Ophidiomyces ophidiicola]KAI1994323.1 hypothetical protein LOZ54_000993 [Ophidiomyces ophidiicola]